MQAYVIRHVHALKFYIAAKYIPRAQGLDWRSFPIDRLCFAKAGLNSASQSMFLLR